MQHLQRQLGSVEYNGKNIAPLEDKGLQHTGFHHLHVRQDLGFKLNTEISTEEEKKQNLWPRYKTWSAPRHQDSQYLRKKKKNHQSLNLCLQSLLKLYKKNPPKVKKYIIYKNTFHWEEGSTPSLNTQCSQLWLRPPLSPPLLPGSQPDSQPGR